MNYRTTVLPILVVAGLFLNATAQEVMKTVWTRTAFEVGVNYSTDEEIAKSTLSCAGNGRAADWYESNIQWSPPNGPVHPTKNAALHKTVSYNGANRDVVFNGAYSVFWDGHVFTQDLANKTVPAVIGIRIHCLDYNNSFADYPAPQQLKICDRVPVFKVTPNVQSVQGGGSFYVKVEIIRPAPESGTRIDLQWTGAGASLAPNAPKWVEVPAGSKDTTFDVITNANTSSPKSLVLAASTNGQPQQASITITK